MRSEIDATAFQRLEANRADQLFRGFRQVPQGGDLREQAPKTLVGQ